MPQPQLICAVDASPSAQAIVPFAGRLAHQFGLRPLLLHAAEAMPLANTGLALRCAERYLEDLAERAGLADAGIHVIEGAPVPAIARLSHEADVRLVVVGFGGYGRFGPLLRGSIARRLTETAGCPVVFVPNAPADPSLQRAVVVGAVSDDDAAATVARTATEAARRMDAHLTLVHVVKADPPVGLPHGRALLQRALTATGLDPPCDESVGRLHLAAGATGREIVAFAEGARATLLVVGPPRRKSLRAALLGSTFDDLRRHSSIPLMVVPVQARHGATVRSDRGRASRPPRGRTR